KATAAAPSNSIPTDATTAQPVYGQSCVPSSLCTKYIICDGVNERYVSSTSVRQSNGAYAAATITNAGIVNNRSAFQSTRRLLRPSTNSRTAAGARPSSPKSGLQAIVPPTKTLAHPSQR